MRHIKRALPEAVALRHEDLYTRGIPDLTVTLAGRTTWWEIKYCDSTLRLDRVQRHVCQRLEETGYCRYVIYVRSPPPRSVRVVRPTQMDHWRTVGDVIPQFDQGAVVRYIAAVHAP